MERTELMTELAELLRAHSRVVRSHLAETLADHGLTPPQLWALHNVAEPCSMGELAGALGVDASYVTALADSLQDKGLVERRPSADDRRRRVLEITDDGRAILDGMHAKVASVPIGGDLGDEELAELVGLLRRRDRHRGVAAEAGEDLAGALRVQERLRRLGLEEVDDGDPVRARHHQRVVGEADHAGELVLHDLLQYREHLRVVHQLHPAILVGTRGFHKHSAPSRCRLDAGRLTGTRRRLRWRAPAGSTPP